MTVQDSKKLNRYMAVIPLISIAAAVLIQWGAISANNTNVEKRIDRLEREKADAAVVENKFNNIDWKLDLIMKNFSIPYIPPPSSTPKRINQ